MHRPDVDRMLSDLSYRQLAEWMAFYRLHPWGDDRADVRSAIVASTVANVCQQGKRRRRYKVKDFMPVIEGRRKSPEEQWNTISSFFADMKAKSK